MDSYSDKAGSVRVRFAPSPTGFLHAGNVRTAIFNWLFANRFGGTMILRMEDTDAERSSDEYAEGIISALKWLGINWDEGPLYQSHHSTLYNRVIESLLDSKMLYPCFCTEEKLSSEREQMRKSGKAPLYLGHCRNIATEEAKEKAEQEPHTLRFKVESKQVEYFDAIRGKIEVDTTLIGDFIVLRSDGSATYNLAAAVDDAMMNISHVIRGEDHISNTSRQVMLLQAMGKEPPIYAHLPLIMGDDGKKLSKRAEGGRFDDLITAGYMPEAVFNFLSLIGWSPENQEENMTKQEGAKLFSLDRVSTRPAKYDITKLKWLNSKKLHNATRQRLIEFLPPFIKRYKRQFEELPEQEQGDLLQALAENMETGLDVDNLLAMLFDEPESQIMPENIEEAKQVAAAGITLAGEGRFKDFTDKLSKQTRLKGKQIFKPLRIALTGTTGGPSLKFIYTWLSQEQRSGRLQKFMESL